MVWLHETRSQVGHVWVTSGLFCRPVGQMGQQVQPTFNPASLHAWLANGCSKKDTQINSHAWAASGLSLLLILLLLITVQTSKRVCGTTLQECVGQGL